MLRITLFLATFKDKELIRYLKKNLMSHIGRSRRTYSTGYPSH